MIDFSKLNKASEAEKIKMAEQAFDEYLAILHQLSKERREALKEKLNKLEQDEIIKISTDLQK